MDAQEKGDLSSLSTAHRFRQQTVDIRTVLARETHFFRLTEVEAGEQFVYISNESGRYEPFGLSWSRTNYVPTRDGRRFF